MLSSIMHHLESSFEIVVVFGNNEGCGFLFDYQGMFKARLTSFVGSTASLS